MIACCAYSTTVTFQCTDVAADVSFPVFVGGTPADRSSLTVIAVSFSGDVPYAHDMISRDGV